MEEARHDVKISCRDIVLGKDGFDGGFCHIHASERVVLRQTSIAELSQPVRVLCDTSQSLHESCSIVRRCGI
jgi:hypothetical protein